MSLFESAFNWFNGKVEELITVEKTVHCRISPRLARHYKLSSVKTNFHICHVLQEETIKKNTHTLKIVLNKCFDIHYSILYFSGEE